MTQSTVINILLIFSAAIAVIIISKRLRIPPVIGFILTGLIWGAVAPGSLNSSDHEMQTFGEVGIVFLLFMIGLDFSPEKVRRLGRIMFVGGSIQAAFTIGIALFFVLSGFISLTSAMLCAFVIIQSSTAIALKVYHDRGELESPHAETSIGIALFQDISAVLILIFIPLLGMNSISGSSNALLTLGKNFSILAAVTAAAYYLLPLILRQVVLSGIRELVVLLSLVFCLGFAFLSHDLGFSMALGSFICGIMLNRSEYHSQITADFAPFRDVFLSLFFISIGLDFNWNFTLGNIWLILGLTIAVVLFKTAVIFFATHTARYPFRTSIITGAGLSNIGEFGFIIMLTALPYGLLSQNQYNLLVSIAIISMLLTPLIILAASKISLFAAPDLSHLVNITRKADKNIRLVIVGFGLAGKHLAHVLKSSSITYSVIEANGGIVAKALDDKEPVIFGDAVRWETLEQSGLRNAQIIVILISDLPAIKRCISLVKQMNPKINIICRTRRMNDIDYLLRAGANEVISEEFETSIELFTIVLNQLHIPRNVIRAQTKILRSDGYEMLRVPSPVKGVSDKLIQILAAGTTDIFQVMDGHFAVGKSIKNIALRNKAGASIITVVKGEKNITNPPPSLILESGDSLVIVGSHAEIDAAFDYLESGTETMPLSA